MPRWLLLFLNRPRPTYFLFYYSKNISVLFLLLFYHKNAWWCYSRHKILSSCPRGGTWSGVSDRVFTHFCQQYNNLSVPCWFWRVFCLLTESHRIITLRRKRGVIHLRLISLYKCSIKAKCILHYYSYITDCSLLV